METDLIQKIFPPINDTDCTLKYDTEGLWSITYPIEADIISNLICKEIGSTSNILDATAGIGGNTISFSKYFKQVVSIELSKSRFELLTNNVNAYKLANVTLINGNCINYLSGNYDGYFFDPPWGGPDYKYYKEIKIKLGEYTLDQVVYKIKNLNDKLIFIKLPFNYNLNEFNNFNYKIDKIKNYQIVTIYPD